MNASSSLKTFLSTFWHFDRRSVSYNLVLNLLAAGLEGLGLMALLPLLNLMGHFQNAEALPDWVSIPGGISSLLESLQPEQRLLLALGVFLGMIGLQSTLVTYREQHSPALQLRFVDYLRTSLFRALAGSRWSFLSRHHSSEFLSVLTSDLQRVGIGTIFLLQLFSQFALFPMYFAVAFILSPAISGLALLTGIFLWWMLRSVGKASKQNGIAVSRANQTLSSEIQEFLGALKLIKIHGETEGYLRQFDHVVTELRNHLHEFYVIRSRLQSIYRIGGAVALALLTYISIVFLHESFESLLVLVAVFARMLPQVSKIHLGFQQLWNMLPAFENWQRWMDACDAEHEIMPADGQSVDLQHGISFQNVCFQHPLSSQSCQVPSLFIPAKQTTVIVGPSGSGKTTFLDLLSGLQQPDSGTILIDGLPLHTASGWCRKLAYVPQDSAILDGTIRENLNWGRQNVEDAQLFLALEQAAAINFVRTLPAGLDTWVGERGVRLSGGEKQRLTLARALLRKPELLILDEATSALDRKHQQIIIEALKNLHGQITVIIVTHHYQDIRQLVDGLIRVEAGRVSSWMPTDQSERSLLP